MKFHTIISDFREKLESSQDDNKPNMVGIEEFYNKLNTLNFLFFSKYYRKYIANLNRLKPQSDEINPDLTLLRVALAENEWKPTTPFSVFKHHLKYDNKITSRFFIAYQKKQNKKRLNALPSKVKTIKNLKSSENWTRVPIEKGNFKK